MSYGMPFWHPSTQLVRDKLLSQYLRPLRRALRLPQSTHRLAIQADLDVFNIQLREAQLLGNAIRRFVNLDDDHESKIGFLKDVAAFRRGSNISGDIVVSGIALPKLENDVKSYRSIGQRLPQNAQKLFDFGKQSTVDIRLSARKLLKELLATDTNGSSLRNIIATADNTIRLSDKGVAEFILYDDRRTASIRSRFRMDRYWLPGMRSRVYKHKISTRCTEKFCISKQRNLTRIHILCDCTRYAALRRKCKAELEQLSPLLIFEGSSIPAPVLLGELPTGLTTDIRIQAYNITGTFLRALDDNYSGGSTHCLPPAVAFTAAAIPAAAHNLLLT